MKFGLSTLFITTTLVAFMLMVTTKSKHPESVSYTLSKMRDVPSDADLKTSFTTLLKPLRRADGKNETDDTTTYFVAFENDYYLVLTMNKLNDDLEFNCASIIRSIDGGNWQYVYPIRTKHELEWSRNSPPPGPFDHYPNHNWGCSF